MESKKQIEVLTEIPINHTMFESKKVTKEKLLKTLKDNVSDTDEIVTIKEISGFHEPGFGSMDDEPIWHHYHALIIRNYREETDEEYFQRMKEKEEKERQFNERERLDYLRLKAKFENDKASEATV